jgi:hypothetical protein
MSASAGFIGAGATLGYATAVTGSYTLVLEVFDVKAPKTETDKVEFTHYTSAGTTKEYKPGWKDASNGSFEANYTEASAPRSSPSRACRSIGRSPTTAAARTPGTARSWASRSSRRTRTA